MDKNNLCSIHNKYGAELKPLMCRAHPYYVYKYGTKFVVLPWHGENFQIVKVKRKNVDRKRQILKVAKDLIKARYFDEIKFSDKRLLLEKKYI